MRATTSPLLYHNYHFSDRLLIEAAGLAVSDSDSVSESAGAKVTTNRNPSASPIR